MGGLVNHVPEPQPIPHVRYPVEYVCLIFVSMMDIIMTRAVIAAGGYEANPIAASALNYGGLWVLITFKFGLTAFVISSCEFIGSREDRKGRWLSRLGVVISGFPSVWAVYLLMTQ